MAADLLVEISVVQGCPSKVEPYGKCFRRRTSGGWPGVKPSSRKRPIRQDQRPRGSLVAGVQLWWLAFGKLPT